MAVSVISPVSGLFDPFTRDKASITAVLQLAMFPQPQFPKGTALATQDGATVAADIQAKRAAARTAKVMLARAIGRPGADFRGVFDTSNNDALASAFSLTAEGVTFPADTVRTIRLRMVSTNNADQFYQEVDQDVYGNDGVTPVLGNARLVKAFMLDAAVYKAMGDIEINSVVDVEGSESAPGSALAAYSSGYALTFPPSRVAIVKGLHVSQDAYEAATSPGHASIEALSASAGTGNVESYVTGTGASTAIAAADLLQISMKLWPVAQIALALNVAAVEVHIRTTLSDIFRHRVEAEIGPAITCALSA